MAIPTTGLIAAYDPIDPSSYNPASPTVMLDTVGNVDLVLSGQTYDPTLGTLTSATIGNYGRSNLGSYPSVDLNDYWSASIWVKPNSIVNKVPIFGIGGATVGTGGGTGYYATFAGNGTQIGHTTCDVVGEEFAFSSNTSTWYNFTWTYDGVTNPGVPVLKMYANGVLIRTLNWGIRDFTLNPSLSNLAYNGYFQNSVPFFFEPLDNNITKGPLLIYNTTLTGPEVQDIYDTYIDRFIGPVHEYDAADPASYPGSGSTLTDIGSAITPINLSIANATFNNVNDSFALNGTLGSYIRSANSLAGFGIGANDFSIQYWFKYDGVTAQPPYNIFLQIGSRSGPGYSGFTNFILSGQFNIGKPGVADYATGFNPVIGTWYQVTMTVNSSNLVTLYINGTSVYTQTIAFVTPDNIIAIGDNGIQTDQVANASMGPLLIYNRVLTTTEITNYYNSTRSRFRVIVQYDFQNGSYSGSGTTINDLLSPQTNLTVDNGHWVAGTPNYWDLQGDTNLVNLSPGSSFSSTTFTVNCWYYPDFSSVDQSAIIWGLGIFGFNPAAPTRAFLSTNNAIDECNQGWDYGYANVSSSVTLEWHLFTLVSNGSTISTYVDGILIGSASSTNGLIGSPYTIRLGSGSSNGNTPQEYSKGKIGFWNYYDIALNSTEVLDLYNATEGSYAAPPPYAGNVGGRIFGEGFNG